MKNMKFKVGDKVRSADDSSDVTMMKAHWVAEIIELKSENDHGGCFLTLGKWEPIPQADGKFTDFWSDYDPQEKPTVRQLWGSHLSEI